ncbi:uncharacterized protein BO95DRAFT_234762 [Aspergillus brunneoviolaceus CBS 621.78]|uniref:Uncharacterized protein n=1 Tax=Aspergillus brunneoviolaceus CBS 621.78 TaxID=1450534 RepID=A0ACD1FZZ5_9EURO|nr:hypothetical protein BO95DRAFT_234762 [Aspergillus brunneoviolaceus CBS 621.78]RAH42544.1 hypothetical protein BO95DRAFT_234762 [Aspergillus brunneoviolaceus CBS 621.78]
MMRLKIAFLFSTLFSFPRRHHKNLSTARFLSRPPCVRLWSSASPMLQETQLTKMMSSPHHTLHPPFHYCAKVKTIPWLVPVMSIEIIPSNFQNRCTQPSRCLRQCLSAQTLDEMRDGMRVSEAANSQ